MQKWGFGYLALALFVFIVTLFACGSAGGGPSSTTDTPTGLSATSGNWQNMWGRHATFSY